jgi:DNA-binding NtrC family response regulator
MSRQVLIVDDEPQFGELYAHTLQKAGLQTQTATSARQALDLIRKSPPDMVISDVRMPGGASGIDLLKAVRATHPSMPFLLVTAYADVRDAVTSLKLGAIDYLSKPVDLDELLVAVTEALGVRLSGGDIPEEAMRGVIAHSPSIRAAYHDAWRVARTQVTVLIGGESGTGKEVLAKFLHDNSDRAKGPFVAVNCASLPGALLASELFGHTKGAFSGAVNARNGRFREAHNGTLFLDEIGDMPLELQPSLLRALETGSITPVGSDRALDVSVRIIAATHQAPPGAVAAGRFREDLFYRLNVISIELPPLRERRDDILPLARALMARANAPHKRLSSAAARALLEHPWPGNVRELANAMTRAALLSRGDVILPEHLPPPLRKLADALPPADDDRAPLDDDDDGDDLEDGPASAAFKTLAQTEVDMVRRALEQTQGNRTRAAELLGITRRGLLKKLKRLGLNL